MSKVDWFRNDSGGYSQKEERGLVDRLMRFAGYCLFVWIGFYFLLDWSGGVNGPLGQMLALPQIIALGEALLSAGS